MADQIENGACTCEVAEDLAELIEDLAIKDEEISLLRKKVIRGEAAMKKLTIGCIRSDERIMELENQLAGGFPQMECNQEKLQSLEQSLED